MNKRPTRKVKGRAPKSVLRLPDSRSPNPPFSTVFRARTRSAATATPSLNSWTGTAPSPGCRSARRLLSGTGCVWSRGVSPRYDQPSSWGCSPARIGGGGLRTAQRRLRGWNTACQGRKEVGCRLGNWLTPEQAQALWQAPDRGRLKGKRDRALLALLYVRTSSPDSQR